MRTSVIFALALTALASCGAASTPAGPVPRYAYVVGCDGIIDKVDTVGNAPVRSVDVGQKLPINHNQFHSGTFDSCLIGHALYVPKESAFYAIVPDRYSSPNYLFAFRFSLPDLMWKKAFAAGEFDGDGYTELALSSAGKVRVATPADMLPTLFDPVTFETFTSSAQSSASLSSVIERSNGTLLIWTPELDRSSTFSVTDIRARTVAKLDLPTGTDKNSVHLVPGGSLVYAEEAHRVPGQDGEGETWRKTGRAQLYDSATGKRVRDFMDRRIATMTLQGISASGKAIYGKDRRYFLLNLGRTFPNRGIDAPPKARSNSIFFAEK